MKYYGTREEAKNHAAPLQRVPLSEVNTINQSQTAKGFLWEVRAKQSRTQHLSPTEEDREKWIDCLKSLKSGPEEGNQSPAAEADEARMKKQAMYEQSSTDELKKQKDKLSAQYKREVEERIFEWKEAKEEVLEAIFEKEKQKLEDEHEARQLELEKELQTRRSKLQLFLKEDEEK